MRGSMTITTCTEEADAMSNRAISLNRKTCQRAKSLSCACKPLTPLQFLLKASQRCHGTTSNRNSSANRKLWFRDVLQVWMMKHSTDDLPTLRHERDVRRRGRSGRGGQTHSHTHTHVCVPFSLRPQ